jgi:hypothetical protein
MDINYSALDCYGGSRIGKPPPVAEGIISFEKSLRAENSLAKDRLQTGSGHLETLGKTTP